jgi:hypothetical protein
MFMSLSRTMLTKAQIVPYELAREGAQALLE